MGFNGPGANYWWIGRSNRNNPKHRDYEPASLVEILNSDTGNYSSNSNGFRDYASRVSDRLSYVIVAGATVGILLFTSCAGGTSPTVTEPTTRPQATSRPVETTTAESRTEPTEAPKDLEATVEATEVAAPTTQPTVASTSEPTLPLIIIEDKTHRFVFPYVTPSGFLEEQVCNNTDVVTCQEFIRLNQGISWAIILASLLAQPVNPSWQGFLQSNQNVIDSSKYIPLEDMRAYHESQLINQTYVPAKPVYFQSTETGQLIPLENPDIGSLFFAELKAKFFEQKEKPEEGIAYKDIPDGSKVVFIQAGSGDELNSIMYLANITTKEVYQLTLGNVFDFLPDISPDGNNIVFSSTNRGGERDAWVMDVGKRTIAKLTDEDFGVEYASWSNDGDKIVFRRSGEVYLADLYQEECRINIASTNALYFRQVFSPDDSSVLYDKGFIDPRITSEDDLSNYENQGVWMVNSDGSDNHQIKKPSQLYEEPDWRRNFSSIDWSINGKVAAIMIESSRSDNETYVGVITMDADGSNITEIVKDYVGDFQRYSISYSEPQWSNDGKFLFYQKAEVSGGAISRQYLVLDIESGETMDLDNFTWLQTNKAPTTVSLGELLGIEGRQPYNADCPTPLSMNQSNNPINPVTTNFNESRMGPITIMTSLNSQLLANTKKTSANVVYLASPKA